jgi:AhpD family alkylhydroperoxidase
MRLSVLDDGHRRRVKLFLALTAATSRVDSPDIVKMLLYRPGFLSGPLLELTADAMRGPSYWTAGEREYLAMCTARLLQCPFCVDTHAELTRIAGHGDIDPDDPGSVRPELRAVQDFLATLTRAPVRADATGVAGLPEHAVLEALRVNLVFGTVNRLANTFGFTLREGQLHSGTRALHRFGYRFPRFLLADGKATDHGKAAGHDETTSHRDAVEELRRAVLAAPATTDPALRTAAATGGRLPEPWRSYAATVRDASHRITGADIDRLIAAGHTEDEIFEVSVAAAVGAAAYGFDAGRHALGHEMTG